LFEFGNTNDPLLGKAISLITGATRAARTTTLHVSSPFRSSQVDKKATLHMQDKHRFDMLEDVRGDEIRKLMEK